MRLQRYRNFSITDDFAETPHKGTEAIFWHGGYKFEEHSRLPQRSRLRRERDRELAHRPDSGIQAARRYVASPDAIGG
ncbi:hypothetical protein WCLP8_2400003 [uncultured Gammaproteobacteria bacterium]